MTRNKKSPVSTSRTGDEFHYRWAARRCLRLLDFSNELKAITIEGPSHEESQEYIEEGEYIIDVGEYYGSSKFEESESIKYVQLKHSVTQLENPFTLSDLRKTLQGFFERYKKFVDQYGLEITKSKLSFHFVSNRNVNTKTKKLLESLSEIENDPHYQSQIQNLLDYLEVEIDEVRDFSELIILEDSEPNYQEQKNILGSELSKYIIEHDTTPYLESIISLVRGKATREISLDPSITRNDLLSWLQVKKEDLFPAPSKFNIPEEFVLREQLEDISNLIEANNSIIIHATGGIGKTVFAHQLIDKLNHKSLSIIYDCFGNAEYRNPAHPRHRHKDALVQISNELASRGLCYPLIPTDRMDKIRLLQQFLNRLEEAVSILKSINGEDFFLSVIIDAADNSVMAADEVGDSTFVEDLLKIDPPKGCKFIFLGRTERLEKLNPEIHTEKIQLSPFSVKETKQCILKNLSNANLNDNDVEEFHRVTSGNPRIQSASLNFGNSLDEILNKIGSTPTTIENLIESQLEGAINQLKLYSTEDDRSKVDEICIGLASLPPLIPLEVLSTVTNIDSGYIKSFVSYFGSSMQLTDSAVQFRDEPTETWFKDNFQADDKRLSDFVEKIKSLTQDYTYVAEALPSLLLQSKQYEDLIDVALSDSYLPQDDPINTKNIKIQRYNFALKACLTLSKYPEAVKLAYRAGEEMASQDRQFEIFTNNVDLIGHLFSKRRIEELGLKRKLYSRWEGSEYIYSSSLLSHEVDFKYANNFLRSGENWLKFFFKNRTEEDDQKLTDKDIVEHLWAYLKLEGPQKCIDFLSSWTPKSLRYTTGKILIRMLCFKSKDNRNHKKTNWI